MSLSLQQVTGSNFSCRHLPFERVLDDAADLGREHLELWGVAPERRGGAGRPPRRADARAQRSALDLGM